MAAKTRSRSPGALSSQSDDEPLDGEPVKRSDAWHTRRRIEALIARFGVHGRGAEALHGMLAAAADWQLARLEAGLLELLQADGEHRRQAERLFEVLERQR